MNLSGKLRGNLGVFLGLGFWMVVLIGKQESKRKIERDFDFDEERGPVLKEKRMSLKLESHVM